jgi:hypothetical protein
VKKLDSVGDGSDGYNAVGETVGLLGFLMMFVKFDTPKAGARFAVSCEDDVGAKLDVHVGLGEVDFAAAVAQECDGYERVVEFFENVADSGFWWEGWEAELAFVGCLEDFSVRDFGSNTVWGRCEVGDGAVNCEVIAGGATVKDCIVVERRGGLTGVVGKSNFGSILVYDISHPYLSGLWLAVGAAAHYVVSGGCDLVALSRSLAASTGMFFLGHLEPMGPAIPATVRECAELGVAVVAVVVSVAVGIVAVAAAVAVGAIAVGTIVVAVVVATEAIFECSDLGVFGGELGGELSNRFGELAHGCAVGRHGGGHIC